jgi:hypothetical protein
MKQYTVTRTIKEVFAVVAASEEEAKNLCWGTNDTKHIQIMRVSTTTDTECKGV